MYYRLILFTLLFGLAQSIQAQSIEFISLDEGDTIDGCDNVTDANANTQCFSVQYTPGVTGSLTSYTLGFLGTCLPSGDAFLPIPSVSCIMEDNTFYQEACSSNGIFLLQMTGNSGNVPIVQNEPIAIHQLCMTIPPGQTIVLTEETTTGLTFSIDSAGTGDPVTEDIIDFIQDELTVELLVCETSNICSIDFSTEGKLIFDTLENGNILDAIDQSRSGLLTQSFDVIDEQNMLCNAAGGADDITFNFQLLNTFDLSNNGLIDSFAGVSQALVQDAQGIKGTIPFNEDMDSESSPGDIRGYSIDITFAPHLAINAHQLSINLDGMNTAGPAYESAALIFHDLSGLPFGTAIYNGFLGGEGDLTGDCSTQNAISPFMTTGTGVVIFADTGSVDISSSCNPINGVDGPNNIMDVNARTHGGLDSAEIIGGLSLIVYGEDVASSLDLDDGSGVAPDDGIRANSKTNTMGSLSATIGGITIDGCVAFQSVLPLDWIDVNASLKKDKVELEWTTENEVNTDYFEVEWSHDDKGFQAIGELKSNNNTGINTYNWSHIDYRRGQNYYRINQIDLDGRSSYSKIISIRVDDSEEFKVYPNPASQVLNLSGFDLDQEVEIQVFNFSGERVLVSKLKSNSIDISTLREGVYHMSIRMENEFHSVNFIKQN